MNRMIPKDVVDWEALAIKSPWISPGKPFTVEQFLTLRIAEAAKWSNAVECIANVAASAAPAGETWPHVLRSLAIKLDNDGKGRLDSKPLGMHTGFAQLCVRLGLLQSGSEAAEAASGHCRVRLGERRELFEMLPKGVAETGFGKKPGSIERVRRRHRRYDMASQGEGRRPVSGAGPSHGQGRANRRLREECLWLLSQSIPAQALARH